ncbi:Multidrug efflux pump subunit AcrB [Desulfocicer vacuolatum DSM 3385]|uniref:Multidrug efflux pump subunit AcrB n=1 Tax=Desulfocicer vacuolatum DSM 3385 TaxID=1121400 RepID=A0A1W2DYM6_9BACT|nr:efflux RND transporter permease subunit [Desulfocicer vacuolatum]SMD02417.1 Multidrug efflux pump subunit AcrB [Desulfocicer vacuolatum DSM 3385]
MNLTQFAIQKNRISLSLLFIVVVMGMALYPDLPRDSMPPYTVRVATIVSSFPGANPQRVELLVSKNIEEVVQEIPEVKTISSQSRTGLSVVTVTLKDEVGPDALQDVWDNLRRKLEDMQTLPQGVTPDLNDDDVGVVYGIILGLLSDEFSYDEMEDVAKRIRDDLITLPDSAKVVLGGIQEQQVLVEFDTTRLSEYGLTAGKLNEIIRGMNILDSGGEINVGNKRLILEPTGNYDTVDALKKTVIPVGNSGETVYLDAITHIRKSYKSPATALVRVNGKRAISLAVSLKEGANITAMGKMIDQKIVDYNRRLPLGLEVLRLASLDGFVLKSIDDFISNLFQSIAIVMVVMLIFLGFRTGIVVSSLIPLVTIMTLMLMGVIQMGLNQVTLAALIMALGMMVDNGIVVSESIIVKLEEGKKRLAAAVETCKELMIPLLISTLTTSAAFLSFYLAESAMGDIVGPLFVVISFALVSSWIVSLTIVPLLAYWIMKVKQKNTGNMKQDGLNGHGSEGKEKRKISKKNSLFDVLTTAYLFVLKSVLKVKILFVCAMLVLFAVSLKGFGMVPFIFFPDSDRNMVTVDINLPLGTRIERTLEVVQGIEDHIFSHLKTGADRQKGIVDWSSFIGKGPESYDQGYTADEANSSYAHILVNTSSGEDNAFIINELDAFCFNAFPDADIRVALLGQGGGGTPVEVRIFGSDQATLYQLATQTKEALIQIPGTKNVMDDWGPKLLKFVINIDAAKAQIVGVTHEDIAVSLQTQLTGYQAGTFREDQDSLAIVMRSRHFTQETLQGLENTNVFVQSTGKPVPLSQVARIIPQWDYAKIMHYDLSRSITVTARIKAGFTAAQINKEINAWLAKASEKWPNHYRFELGGDEENTQENMAAVTRYLPLSGCIILLLLIIQFNSMRKTAMVVTTIPLGIIGVVIGLIAFRSYFGFMGFLGVISLAGIVINNAIVLIDRIEIEQMAFGRQPSDAVVEACRQRFRPILLTTLTTTLGLIPLYLGGGSMWEPMAISIMIGLLFGTTITLLFIPALYSVLYRVNHFHPE